MVWFCWEGAGLANTGKLEGKTAMLCMNIRRNTIPVTTLTKLAKNLLNFRLPVDKQLLLFRIVFNLKLHLLE